MILRNISDEHQINDTFNKNESCNPVLIQWLEICCLHNTQLTRSFSAFL